MSQENPCRHPCDWTDGDEPTDNTDLGCCAPYPIRKSCDAPELPVPECDEQPAELTYDEETEEFVATTRMYDSDCGLLLDSDSEPLLSLIA